jgi:hypothetical protein
MAFWPPAVIWFRAQSQLKRLPKGRSEAVDKTFDKIQEKKGLLGVEEERGKLQ